VFAACPTLLLILKGSNPVHSGNNIHDTFPTGTWPDATELLGKQCLSATQQYPSTIQQGKYWLNTFVEAQFNPKYANN
jgi:hypothetical protein